jgi:threonine/homoserine/homoserine lactone efflux protein
VPDPSRLALFTGAALLLLVVPGPAVLYVVTQSVSHGRRAGLASVAGITTGTIVHVAAATIGLSALLASSAVAFDVVKYLGAAYLIVVGIRRLAGVERPSPMGDGRERDLGRLYRQGIVVNVLNPKTALFFLAFLPQFVEPSRGAAWGRRSSCWGCSSPSSASSATARGPSSRAPSASGCAAASAFRRCSGTYRGRCSSASARSPR